MKKLLVILLLLFPVHGAWAETFVSIGKYSLGQKINEILSPKEIKKYKEFTVKYNYSSYYLDEFNKKIDILEFINNDIDVNYDKFQIYYDKNSLKIENSLSVPLKVARENFEKGYLTTQLKKFSGNISKTAKFVGMERSALHRKLKGLGVKDLN